MATDYPDFQTPQAHADSIAATGAPLINLSALNQSATRTVATTFTEAPITVSQIAYELAINAQMATVSAGATVVDLTMAWTDSVTGLNLATKQYQFVCGPNGTDHQIKIQGPAHADTLTMTWTNNSVSATSALIKYTLIGSSRLFRRDVPRTGVFAQSGFSGGAPLPGYGVLGNVSFSVGAGATATRLLAMYSGQVRIQATTASLTNDCHIDINEAATAVPLLQSGSAFYRKFTDGNGNLSDSLVLPNVQAILNITNQNAGAKTVTVGVFVDESLE